MKPVRLVPYRVMSCPVLSCCVATLPALPCRALLPALLLITLDTCPRRGARHVYSARLLRGRTGVALVEGRMRWCSDLDTALGMAGRAKDDGCRGNWRRMRGATQGAGMQGQAGRRQTVDGTADLRPGRAVGELSIDHLSVGSCRPPDSVPSQNSNCPDTACRERTIAAPRMNSSRVPVAGNPQRPQGPFLPSQAPPAAMLLPSSCKGWLTPELARADPPARDERQGGVQGARGLRGQHARAGQAGPTQAGHEEQGRE